MIVAIMTTALSGTVWAETYSYTFQSKQFTANGTQTLNSVSWTLAGDGGYWGYDATKGQQFGSGNKPYKSLTLTTSGISGTITSIVVNASTGSSATASISCTVGDNNFGTSGQSLTASAANYTFSGNASGNIVISMSQSTSKALYIKSITVTYTSGTPTPSISANDVNIEYSATNGSIAYTLSNATGNVTASVEGDWLTLGTITSLAVPFTCSENPGKTARTATVTLSYPDAPNKVVHVTQAGNPNVVDNISDITAAGTYTVKGTIVAKSQRGFIVGDGTGYVYYYNQNYTQSNYNIGDKVKLDGSVVVYGGVFEFNNSTTVTAATESNYVAEEPTVLTGSQMDTRVGSTTPAELSTYVQYEGVLTVDGTHYNITSIDGASTAKGSISYPLSTEFTSLDGKQVKVTGYYVGISSSTYYNTMIGSIEEVVSNTPIINVNVNSVGLDYDATSGEFGYSIVNPADGVNLSATANVDWISNITIGASAVTFTTTANEGTTDREATITLSYTGAENKTVTVTQGHYVADYATLPFSFDDGREEISNTAGLTQEGLDSDYGSSPKLKFNGAGDYVILKINERPGTLTFDIKGNGAGNDPWAGTFKVQASEDGTTYSDVTTYNTGDLTSTKDTKTIDNFGADVRYIKWIYTSKTTGNVALGNISLETYSAPVPSITVTPATATPSAADVEGTLDITYENLAISDMTDFDVQFYDAEGNELNGNDEPDWIEVLVAEQDPSIGEGYVVSYIIDANTGAARTAYFKVFALGDQDYVYSNLVTVTQDAYVAPPTPGTEEWVETALAGLTSSDIFVIVGDEAYALPNDGGSSAPVVVAVTVTGDKITSAVTDNLKWNISGNSTDGYVFYPNGETDTWLYCGTTSGSSNNNNIKVGDGARKNFVLDGDGYLVTEDSYANRYLSIYVNSGTPQDWRGYVNTASAVSIKFYKKVEAPATESVTVTDAGYATYCSENALDFSESSIKAYIASADGTTGVTFTKIDKVPAGTGVLLYKDGGATENIPVFDGTGAEDTSDNVFVPGTGAAVASEGTGVKNYILSSGNKGVGFYPASGKTVAVGKAYISVSTETNVKGFIMLPDSDDPTAIEMVNGQSSMVNEIYNLAGQRINKLQKGINIVNGKKILK